MRYNAKSKKEGFILPLVIIVMVIMVTVGFGMLSLGYNARMLAVRQAEDTYSIAAAEAGVAHIVSRMNEKLAEDDEWDNTTLFTLNIPETELPNSYSSYFVKISGDPTSGFVITSTGTCGIATRTFYALTLLRGVFDYGILARNTITLKAGSSAMGYNLKTGEMGLSTILATARTQGEGSINLNGAYVNGSVLVGPYGNADEMIVNEGVITGIKGDMENFPKFPAVSPPSELEDKGTIEGNVVLNGASGSGRYDGIVLKGAEALEIEGDVILHVTGEIIVPHFTQIKIKEASSLTLYVNGKFEVKDNAIISNLTERPEKFKLFGSAVSAQEIIISTVHSNYNFYGAVYAPNARVEMNVRGDLYGSFVCDSFELKSVSTFYHDRSISKDINQDGVYFGIGRWYEP
ncbi:MAG: hypothetical protein WC962_00450 [Phycisphaerae bacterium]|jgi:hypothetical protein